MPWRWVVRVTAIVLTALVVPVAVGAVGIAGVRGEIYTPRDATAPPVSVEAAAIPAHDPTKPTAVVVLSPDYSPGGAAPIPRYRPAAPDVVGLLSAAYRWNRPNMGVLLTDGVGEIELASAFRPYTVFRIWPSRSR